MTREKTKQLQEVLTSPNYEQTWGFFAANFLSNPSFAKKGKRTKNKLIKIALERVAKSFFKTDHPRISKLNIFFVKNLGFFHGNCFVEGYACAILHFPKANTGIFMMSAPSSPNMEFFRFTTYVEHNGLFNNVGEA